MCTVTWHASSAGISMYFNRDEQRARTPAKPPRLLHRGGVRVLAPHDPAGGGTWICVNSHGLAAGLLNHGAPVIAHHPAAPSRGRLLLDLSDAPDVATFGCRLRAAVRAGPCRPCVLLALDRAGMIARWSWNGRRLTARALPLCGVITTSSWDGRRVTATRRRRFRALLASGPPTAASFTAYHHAGEQPAGPASVRMSRPDARTVSFTRLEIGRKYVRLFYAPRQGDGGFGQARGRALRLKPRP
jgi:hypothetical protein